MALIDNLSTLRQKLVASVPVSLGVRQYQPIVLKHKGNEYHFTAKITELTPGQKVNYIASGVMINNETRNIADVPFSIPFEAVQQGLYSYSGVTADVMSVDTKGTVSYTVMVQEFRDR